MEYNDHPIFELISPKHTSTEISPNIKHPIRDFVLPGVLSVLFLTCIAMYLQNQDLVDSFVGPIITPASTALAEAVKPITYNVGQALNDTLAGINIVLHKNS